MGDDPASQIYVRNKHEKSREAGMVSFNHVLAAGTPQDEVADLIQQLNEDDSVHGILLQLPAPDQIDDEAMTALVDPAKDVDGLTPVNAGLLVQEQVLGWDLGERGLSRFGEAAATADRIAGRGEHEHRQQQADGDRDQREPLHAARSWSRASSAGSLVTSACSSGLATILSGIRSSPATSRPEPVGQASR